VEELPGANTQGATMEEARENLKEAVVLTVETNRALTGEMVKDRKTFREQLICRDLQVPEPAGKK
jgi:predicted RNase H-like HicB family nuclease